ncbi:MAG: M3 family metallopeptidase [Thermoanaerobaculia bacterium]
MSFPPPERITIPILDDVTLTASWRETLRAAREQVARMQEVPLDALTPENILEQWDRDSIALEDVTGPISILNNVHPDRRVRDAADAVMIELSSFESEIFQNEKLYDRVRAVRPASPAQVRLQKDLLESFEDSGVSLPSEKRRRVREIDERISEIAQDFEKHIRENEARLTFRPEETTGLPQAWLDRVERDPEGNAVVGFDSPEYVPFMANAENESARRRYYVAYTNRGTPENLALLDEMVRLRREIAGLYGVGSYAHYVTRRRMVGNPETVRRFLDDVREVVAGAEQRDLADLRAIKAELTGTALEETRLHRWDLSYYTERVRERRYRVDQEELRKFFPIERTIDWVLGVCERLYRIRFERAAVPLWHPDVRYFDVREAGTLRLLGGVYMDLFPRDGKFKHAAAWPVRGVSRRFGRTPISALVANFDRSGFTHDELETFFHELGHVLHGVLSETQYNHHAGTSVQRDFVEAPSQIHEEWARRYESLRTLGKACPECPAIDRSLVERLDAARRFGQGILYARQLLYSDYDMALAGENPEGALETWKRMEGATALGHEEGTSFPGTFAHIADGYAAGYYGYMWAEVLALDMLSAYGDDLMDPEVGLRYRQTILARGGEEPARELVERFLGRAVDSRAFFAEITGKKRA